MSSVIDFAIASNATTGMGFLSGTTTAANRISIATFLETFFNTSPISASPAFQTGTTVGLGSYLVMSTATTNLSVIQTVSSPSKGSVSYNTATPSFTYTPSACQTGADSFTYRARNAGDTVSTSTRTVNVTIGAPPAPTINSSATANGVTGSLFSYSITVASCTSLVTSYAAAGLPAGLSINTGTGVISGTPTAVGVFPVNISATNAGGTGNSVVTITITLGAPVITSAATANGADGVVFGGYTITATNSPTSFGAAGLPPGLSVNPVTGLISGTPTASGVFAATVSATNATGTGNQGVTFTIAVGVPAVTSANSASGQTGVAFTYTITATNSPTSFGAAGLPPGLSVNPGTGVISGAPTAIGVYNATVSATNGTGTGNLGVTFTITLGPPVITSANTANGAQGVAFVGYQITATNTPHTGYNATGLPPGLSVNPVTGFISGTPTTSGVFIVDVSATNATGTGNMNVTFNIALFAPVNTSPGTASGQTGVAFTYQITANNGPTSFNAAGLPPGLTVDTTTGLISGTPTAVGVFNATITSTNGAGSDVDPLVITITLGPPVITSANAAAGSVGAAFSYQITATNPPHTSYNAVGLPPGVSVNPVTGLISGTPTAVGVYNATVSATNATATGNLAVTITISVGVPVITSPSNVGGATGAAFTYQITATNAPHTSYGATGMPPGLSLDTSTGLITGTPSVDGTYAMTVSATNGTGTGMQTVTVTISLSGPIVTSPTTASGTVGVEFFYQVLATNSPTSYSATGLPPGLTLNTTNGAITGAPTSGGVFPAVITATNATGSLSYTLTITIAFIAPTATDVTVGAAFQTATQITLPVTGQFTQINIVTLPNHGLVATPAPGSNIVVYTPANGYSGPDSFTYTVTNPAGTSAPATVTINVGTQRPVGAAASMTVQLNTATTIDLASFITGSAITGVSVSTAAHGATAVNGTKVTYTPNRDYFGTDSFTYIAFGNAGSSSSVVVNVTVVGRPDPSADADVRGVVDTQTQAARRFARAQIGNYQRRMETLHRSAGEKTAPASTGAASNGNGQNGGTKAAPSAASSALVGSAIGAASTGSIDLASLSNGFNGNGNGANRFTAGTEIWIGGTAHFGSRDNGGGNSRFRTEGISVGADRRLNERLALGMGVGFAQDDTDIGTNGTKSKSRGASVAAYGSYQLWSGTFIDGLLGYGKLNLDSDRYVVPIESFALGRRRGDQLFGSVAAGYEHRRDNLLLSPYARLDFSVDKLDQSTESGAGQYNLTYLGQTQRNVAGVLGVRAESMHETDFGLMSPRVRAEYRRDIEGSRATTLAYADLFSGPRYSVTPAGTSRNHLALGVGADFIHRGGLRVGVDYLVERSNGARNVQSINLLVSQDLDARGLPAFRFDSRMFEKPVTVDASIAFDDNVTRGRLDPEIFSDTIFTASASQQWPFMFGKQVRLLLTGSGTGDKFRRHTGLGRFSGSLQGELQYRGSGAFDATTYSLVSRASYDYYESRNRTGPKYYVGVNARRSFTDKIDAFGEVGASQRYGKSDVFNLREYSGRFNLDYSLGKPGIVYIGGEYRRGDTVSSGFGSLVNVGLADVFVPEDAFDVPDLFAYRFDARTYIGTIGYNRPLGPRDSIDFSWRRVQASPTRRPSFDGAGSIKYNDNQYSIVYLLRF